VLIIQIQLNTKDQCAFNYQQQLIHYFTILQHRRWYHCVDITDPAEIDEFYGGPDTLLENQTFMISCNMQGNPDPDWQIYNEDTGESLMRAHVAASGTIGPNKARCESAGFWACTGINNLNKHGNVTRGFNLTVYCK